MFRLSKLQVGLIFVTLMLLRIAVGWHFFNEGADKIQSGDFNAEYFLRSAKGPIAPRLRQLLDDPDGRLRFGVVDDGQRLDPELTFAIWDDYLDRAWGHYGFEDREIEQQLIERRAALAERIQQARANRDPGVDVDELEAIRQADEEKILRLRTQLNAGEQILNSHIEEFTDWLDANRTAILAWYGTRDREYGFDRDGPSRVKAASFVPSLREQVQEITADRQQQMKQWTSEVDAIWNSYEREILNLPIEEQDSGTTLALHRPFAQQNSKLKWVNWLIPWFDIVVGGLLIVGLFTRLASLAAAVFLLSVIATQPPWIPGTEPTYLYLIEFVALLVIMATAAGRMGGLDFFLSGFRRQPIAGAAMATSNDQVGMR